VGIWGNFEPVFKFFFSFGYLRLGEARGGEERRGGC
jgi:hypothetical protein